MDAMMDAAPHHPKYHKLAAEYAKVRAQVAVLRKAVIEEQTKGNDIKDSLKERDQSLRKNEQELESLTFRNQQLSKRVTVLQEELEGMQSKAKKIKHKSNDAVPAVSISHAVIGEELESKIEENAKLHQELYEAEREHRARVTELTQQLDTTRQEAARVQQVLDTIHDEKKGVIDKLQQDKAQMEVRLQTQEKDLKQCRAKAEETASILKKVQSELGRQLREAEDVVEEHVTFNDTRIRVLDALNVPVHDRQYQTELMHLLSHVETLVRDLVAGLSNYHTYAEQRVRIVQEGGSKDAWRKTVSDKFAQHLHENAVHLRPLERAFQTFVQTLREEKCLLEISDGLREFSRTFGSYVAYLNKLLPYHHLSIEEECSLLSCTPALEAKNRLYGVSVASVTSAFNRINTYVVALASQSDPRKANQKVCQVRLIHLLVDAVHNLKVVVKEASAQYNAKVSLEHELPTVTQKLKTTDECVLSSMVSLVTTTAKLSVLLNEKLVLSTKSVCWIRASKQTEPPNLRLAPVTNKFRHRATRYLADVENEERSAGVPYEEALKNRDILQMSTESRESLARQLTSSQDKIAILEQAKEHWMLEFQLLQIKYEKETKKLHKLEEQLRSGSDGLSTVSSSSSTDDAVTPPASVAELSSGSSSTVSLLGKLDILGTQFLSPDSREAEVKSYFLHHVKELVSQMQTADSKATLFHSELVMLQNRLQLAEKCRHALAEELAAAQKTTGSVKEELSTTTVSYENQLSMMSEHLANMNDKLTAQKDEIDALKYQMDRTGPKKGKGK